MITTYRAAPDIDVVSSTATIADFGSLAINAFVMHGDEPLLVDTGAVVETDDFMTALRTVIDPTELRWIWLSHTDFDHIGSLPTLLDENPQLRVITTFFGMGIMGLSSTPLPLDRVRLVNPGQRIRVGDRTLRAIKPPVYDNAVTTGFYDATSRTLFSADCFGALLRDVPQSAADISDTDLRDGQTLWVTIDSPWIHNVDRKLFADQLAQIGGLDPTIVLSGHLPPAPGAMLDKLLDTLAAAPDAPTFVGPDHAMLEQMLAGMTAGPAE
ncbi:MAG: MBL fold metallo-hydrolase [Acidimicrobiia bacterium]